MSLKCKIGKHRYTNSRRSRAEALLLEAITFEMEHRWSGKFPKGATIRNVTYNYSDGTIIVELVVPQGDFL